MRKAHFLLLLISRISSHLIVSWLISCHISSGILTRTKCAWSFPGFILFPEYRKARGPYRYLQHTPVIQMFSQLGSPLIAVTPVIGILQTGHHWAPVNALFFDSFSCHSFEFFCCALLCILILVKTTSLPREVKRLISSCGSPGQLQDILGASTHSCENILLAFELYEIKISSSSCSIIADFYYTAHHWAVMASMPIYCERLYYSSLSSCAFHANLHCSIPTYFVVA